MTGRDTAPDARHLARDLARHNLGGGFGPGSVKKPAASRVARWCSVLWRRAFSRRALRARCDQVACIDVGCTAENASVDAERAA